MFHEELLKSVPNLISWLIRLLALLKDSLGFARVECGVSFLLQILILKRYSSCSHQHLLSLPPLRIKIQLTQFHNHNFFSYSLFFRILCQYIHILTELIFFLCRPDPVFPSPLIFLPSATNCGTEDIPLFANARVGPGPHFQHSFYPWVGSSRGIS